MSLDKLMKKRDALQVKLKTHYDAVNELRSQMRKVDEEIRAAKDAKSKENRAARIAEGKKRGGK